MRAPGPDPSTQTPHLLSPGANGHNVASSRSVCDWAICANRESQLNDHHVLWRLRLSLRTGVLSWGHSKCLAESPDERANALIANLERGVRHRPPFCKQFERAESLHLPPPLPWAQTDFFLKIPEQRALRWSRSYHGHCGRLNQSHKRPRLRLTRQRRKPLSLRFLAWTEWAA